MFLDVTRLMCEICPEMHALAKMDKKGKNSPNFNEHVMTKQRGALKLALSTKVGILAKMAELANKRQIVNKISNEMAKDRF